MSTDKPFDLFDSEKGLVPPTKKVTEAEYNLTWSTYPELTPDPNRKCTARGCNKHPMRMDCACIKHTRKSLKTYDIPWLCTAIKANGKRCTQIVLEGKLLCAMHYKKQDGPKPLGRLTMTKAYMHQQAMISPNPEDWKQLIAWSCETPRDLVKVLEETLNRYRYGTINKEQVMTISSLAKRILEIMTITKEAGLADEVTTKIPDKQWQSDTHKIVSFKTRLQEMVAKKEETVLHDTSGEVTSN